MLILHIYLITQKNCNTYIFVFVLIPYMNVWHTRLFGRITDYFVKENYKSVMLQ